MRSLKAAGRGEAAGPRRRRRRRSGCRSGRSIAHCCRSCRPSRSTPRSAERTRRSRRRRTCWSPRCRTWSRTPSRTRPGSHVVRSVCWGRGCDSRDRPRYRHREGRPGACVRERFFRVDKARSRAARAAPVSVWPSQSTWLPTTTARFPCGANPGTGSRHTLRIPAHHESEHDDPTPLRAVEKMQAPQRRGVVARGKANNNRVEANR